MPRGMWIRGHGYVREFRALKPACPVCGEPSTIASSEQVTPEGKVRRMRCRGLKSRKHTFYTLTTPRGNVEIYRYHRST